MNSYEQYLHSLVRFANDLQSASEPIFWIDQSVWVLTIDIALYRAKIIAIRYAVETTSPGWYYRLSIGETWIHESNLYATMDEMIAEIKKVNVI